MYFDLHPFLRRMLNNPIVATSTLSKLTYSKILEPTFGSLRIGTFFSTTAASVVSPFQSEGTEHRIALHHSRGIEMSTMAQSSYQNLQNSDLVSLQSQRSRKFLRPVPPPCAVNTSSETFDRMNEASCLFAALFSSSRNRTREECLLASSVYGIG